MKRIISVAILLFTLFSLIGCGTEIKDYAGTPISDLTFETVDYNGGYTDTYVFDFENNTLAHRGYLPYGETEPEFDKILTFTDEEETVLINKLYSFGLFDIKENYPSPSGIVDGGGWTLTIKYSDASVNESRGSNNSPDSVFDNCAKAFYDICGRGIVGYVPTEYYSPPNVSYTFKSASGGMGYSPFGKRVNYKWNGFEEQSNSIYELNQSTDFPQKFYEGDEYTLVLYTANYGDYDKFKKCTVTSYDYNENLTNPTVVHTGKWFKQIEFNLQLNKIYLIKFEFANGDFVEYTFNTKTVDFKS